MILRFCAMLAGVLPHLATDFDANAPAGSPQRARINGKDRDPGPQSSRPDRSGRERPG